MSLVVDINKWVKNTFINLVLFVCSVFVVALLLYLLLNSGTYRNGEINNSSSKHNQINLIEQTRIELILRTLADLSNRMDVPENDIVLESITDKIWKDTSLECPNPLNDSSLTLVPELYNKPGWLIAWKFENIVYEYNTSINGEWVLCSKIEIS